MELSKNTHNKTNSGGYSELFFSLLRYSLFGAFLNKLRDDETQEKIKSFRCSLFGAFSKAQYCNATIYSDLFRCSSFGAFSKYSYKKVLLSCIVSFDAPYLELSLNAIWRSNYASLFLFRYSFIGAFFKVRSWKESIIRPLCFDAPYLELSLNMVNSLHSLGTYKFRCSLFGAFFKWKKLDTLYKKMDLFRCSLLGAFFKSKKPENPL